MIFVCYRLLDVVVAISGPQGDADLSPDYLRRQLLANAAIAASRVGS
jgi:hypothetical protein